MNAITSDNTLLLHGFLERLQRALAAGDIEGVASLFAEGECYWRDLLAFTWNIATVEGRDGVKAMLSAQLQAAAPVTIVADGPATVVGDRVEGWILLETSTCRGRGFARLRDGKCWTLFTAMTELKGFEEPSGRRRVAGSAQVAERGRQSWLAERTSEVQALGTAVQPYCLVVGGGQGGLALGARLRRLGVPTLIVDAHERPGDAWRDRYHSLYLHDAVWSDHLPYMDFPDHWPVYMSKDKMADWLEMYAKVMELNFWGSTTCRHARYDAAAECWQVEVERAGEVVVLSPKHLVLATGLSGRPSIPAFPGAESFAGVQMHSSAFRDAEKLAGKRCVVVGANNSAHDICVDLWSAGIDVTMIQRSPTTVIKASALRRRAERGPHSESGRERGISTERADLTVASMPYRAKEPFDRADCERIQTEDAAFYERLRASGFLFDFGEDNTGISGKYPRRASGYYIDVGGSDLIASGEIKLRSGVGVASLRPHSIVLTDGSELPADAIIYATGYGQMVGSPGTELEFAL